MTVLSETTDLLEVIGLPVKPVPDPHQVLTSPTAPTVPVAAKSRRSRGVSAMVAAMVMMGALSGGAVALFTKAGAPAVASSSGSVVAASTTSTIVVGTPESAAAAIAPSVVTVEVSGQQMSDTGSGVIIRANGSSGDILTNNHVVAAAENGGGTVHVTLADGRTVAASIVGYDSTADLAVLKVIGVSGLTAAVFADSSSLQVGQAVLAVGAPLGLSNTVTEGIVSALNRPVSTESGSLHAVQTDAAINPGNSGGALVDLAGRVVGINTAIASTGTATGQSGNIGVGFAIPAATAVTVANRLLAQA